MSFYEIARELEILEYPAELDSYYPVPEARKAELCSLSMIDRLHTQFDLFGPYYHEVRKGFMNLENDPERKACLDVYSLFIKDHDAETARRVYCPKLTGTKGSNMLGLLIHLPSVKDTYRRMICCGLSHQEVTASLQIYRIFLREVIEFRHGFIGYTPDVARWLTYCTKGEMYRPGFGGFYYQEIRLPEKTTPCLLKNKVTGEVIPVYGDGQRIHRSGVPLGSEGAEDEDGAFETIFAETDDAFAGHPVRNCKVSSHKESFPKAQWERIFAPAADAISMHVFFEADLSPEAVAASLEAGCEMARRLFPDKVFGAVYCSSWLLHPAVTEILGPDSKISKFASNFIKFPCQSGAKAVFHYAFPGEYPSLEALPETSRLQRGLKQRILNGAFINDTSGIILL